MKLHRFTLNIDTCPVCGREIYMRENGVIGEPDIEQIPADTVFVYECNRDEEGRTCGREPSCGEFRISRVDPTTLDNDWKCEYVIIGEDFLE